jgi:hypothetical protein
MTVKEKQRDKIAGAFSNPETITRALSQGVRDALLKHKRAGNPIVVWRNGKTIWLKPEDILVQKS